MVGLWEGFFFLPGNCHSCIPLFITIPWKQLQYNSTLIANLAISEPFCCQSSLVVIFRAVQRYPDLSPLLVCSSCQRTEQTTILWQSNHSEPFRAFPPFRAFLTYSAIFRAFLGFSALSRSFPAPRLLKLPTHRADHSPLPIYSLRAIQSYSELFRLPELS
jgi:hypothetical protein